MSDPNELSAVSRTGLLREIKPCKKLFVDQMLFNVHALVWDADNLDVTARHTIKNYVAAFGETAVAFLHVIFLTVQAWDCRRAIGSGHRARQDTCLFATLPKFQLYKYQYPEGRPSPVT